jgi:hypothetical protein
MNHVSNIVAGFYKRRLVRGGPWVPVRLWYGPPNDPVTGEELDRSHRWQALVNGEEADPDETWIGCCGNPIDAQEYGYLLAMKNFATNHAPELPEASPRQPINLGSMKPLF